MTTFLSKRIPLLLLLAGLAVAFPSLATSQACAQNGPACKYPGAKCTVGTTVGYCRQLSDECECYKGAKPALNSATKEELEALPEIGAAYSQKIIDGRPYAKVSDLVKKKIIPKDVYEKVKNEVTVSPR
jgi:hypothetical protein